MERHFTETQIRLYFRKSHGQELTDPNNSNEISTVCPKHQDNNPSFNINTETGLWFCHACGVGGNLYQLEQLISDCTITEAKKNVHEILGLKPTLECEHVYQNADGTQSFVIQRYIIGLDKQFRVFHWNEGKKEWTKPAKTLLYHLPEVIKAQMVFITEGEKKCDAVMKVLHDNQMDFIACTTAPFGARKWLDEYSHVLQGKQVYIFLDNNQEGYEHGEQVAASVSKVADVRIVKVPGGKKEDIDDFIQKHPTAIEKIVAMVETAEPYQPNKLTTEGKQWAEPKTEQTSDKLSDLRAAELFVNQYKNQVRYDHQQKRWLLWQGHHWQEDINNTVAVMAQETIRGEKANESKNKISNALWFAGNQPSISIHCENDGWNQSNWLLAVGNGVVDLKTGQLRDGKQEDKITTSSDVNFNSKAECPTWLKFLKDIMQDDPEMVVFLQRAVGYSITGSIAEQVFFVGYGTGSNGKGIFLQTLRHVLGEYGQDAASGTFEHGKGQSIPSDLARLVDRRFVVASEVGKEARFNEQRLKSVSHGDRQRIVTVPLQGVRPTRIENRVADCHEHAVQVINLMYCSNWRRVVSVIDRRFLFLVKTKVSLSIRIRPRPAICRQKDVCKCEWCGLSLCGAIDA